MPTKQKDFSRIKDIVTKMQSHVSIWNGDQEQVQITTKITEQHMSNIDNLDKCTMIFQSHIKKALELPVTIVGEDILCAVINSNAHENIGTDWRVRGPDTLDFWFKYDLPDLMKEKLLQLTQNSRVALWCS